MRMLTKCLWYTRMQFEKLSLSILCTKCGVGIFSWVGYGKLREGALIQCVLSAPNIKWQLKW